MQSELLDPQAVGKMLQTLDVPELRLSMITNRGIMVWPKGFEETFCTDHWRCRFEATGEAVLTKKHLIDLLSRADAYGIDTIKTENLYSFNGKPAFSLAQGH